MATGKYTSKNEKIESQKDCAWGEKTPITYREVCENDMWEITDHGQKSNISQASLELIDEALEGDDKAILGVHKMFVQRLQAGQVIPIEVLRVISRVSIKIIESDLYNDTDNRQMAFGDVVLPGDPDRFRGTAVRDAEIKRLFDDLMFFPDENGNYPTRCDRKTRIIMAKYYSERLGLGEILEEDPEYDDEIDKREDLFRHAINRARDAEK